MINDRTPGELARRYIGFIVSLFVIALGTSLSIRANLGSSPISCPPYILSLRQGAWSMGSYVICMHVLFVLIQIALLRRQFKPIQFLQLAVSLLFGVFTDITMWMTSFTQVAGTSIWAYGLRFLQLLIGGTILALGIAMEVRCDVLVLAGEGFPLAVAKVTKKDFGSVKIFTDGLLVAFGIAFMFIYFGTWSWEMVGLGTLIAIFWVGFVVRLLTPYVRVLDRFLITSAKPLPAAAEPQTTTGHPLVITISREYGSGGREIGELLSKQLGIPLYDRTIINRSAQELGLRGEQVAGSEQNMPRSALWKLVLSGGGLPPSVHLSQDEALFIAQSRVVSRLADEGSCVIIGRLANFCLRHRPNTLRVFVCTTAPIAAERIAARENISLDEARERYEQTNRARANHYLVFTSHRWADPRGYDLVINTARVSPLRAAELITQAAHTIADS